MIRPFRLAALVLVLVPVIAACGRNAGSGGTPTVTTLYASRLNLSDVAPTVGDAHNWLPTAPTFDVPPLNSGSRDDANPVGLTIRFAHSGTAELLEFNYQVWLSTSIATNIEDFQQTVFGTPLTGPAAGDKVLYYNRKRPAGAAPFANVAYVRVGQTTIIIAWSHIEGYASTKTFGQVVSKAATRLKDGVAGKLHASPPKAPDPLLLAPASPQLTLLGATTLPIEVMAQAASPESSPGGLIDELHANGVTDSVFGDYALNIDTRMEVLTFGIVFPNVLDGGVQFVDTYLGAKNGTGGGYDPADGQYVYGIGGGGRAVLVICKSTADGEEAGRACEAPLAVVLDGWHQALH